MDLDPIKQLQSLLEDRGKVLEKISSIQSALGSLGVSAEPESPTANTRESRTTPNPFHDDRVYGRLGQTLHELQIQIEQRVRPLALQAVEFQVARLREQSGRDQEALHACLVQVDQCIVNCVEQVQEYQKKHAFLTTLNQRIANLGATPEPMPDSPFFENIDSAMQARIESVLRQNKL